MVDQPRGRECSGSSPVSLADGRIIRPGAFVYIKHTYTRGKCVHEQTLPKPRRLSSERTKLLGRTSVCIADKKKLYYMKKKKKSERSMIVVNE